MKMRDVGVGIKVTLRDQGLDSPYVQLSPMLAVPARDLVSLERGAGHEMVWVVGTLF